ncbi:hypothetical protein VTK73DRAFT_1447 [Phialemonium thermophilum]|uniref:Uncharacterized protein n=1 Tax=Phialemonium thermophilum TaxID=223376 RepID=A0ABR3VTE0_9PEZI
MSRTVCSAARNWNTVPRGIGMLTPGTSWSSLPRSGLPSGQRQMRPSPPVTIHTSSTVRWTTPTVTCPGARRKLAVLARSVLARIRTSEPSGAMTSAVVGSATAAGSAFVWEELPFRRAQHARSSSSMITALAGSTGGYLPAAVVPRSRLRHGSMVSSTGAVFGRISSIALVSGSLPSRHSHKGGRRRVSYLVFETAPVPCGPDPSR